MLLSGFVFDIQSMPLILRMDSQKIMLAVVFDQEFSCHAARGNPVMIQTILDGRRFNSSQLAAYLVQILSGLAKEIGARKNPGASLAIGVRFWFNPNLDFQWYFLPNLIGLISMMPGLIVTGLSVAREREMGTFSQLLVSLRPSQRKSPLASLCLASLLAFLKAPCSGLSPLSALACPLAAPSGYSGPHSQFFPLRPAPLA